METSHIIAYIEYLKQACGLAISVHLVRCTGHRLEEALLPYNIHENPYCVYLKLQPSMWHACVEKQGRVLQRCQKGAFCGTCHAGVREAVYPVFSKGEAVGFVSVGGYADENGASYVARISEKYGFPRQGVEALYHRLAATMPPRRQLDTLLYPLCAMLQLALESEAAVVEEPLFSVRLMHYLRLNHTRRLTMEEICEEFHCSPSYVSHRFKEQTGLTVHQYLTRLRVENAARLLRMSRLQITEVAMATGFESSNYFSHVFRTEMGVSPRDYRQAAEKEARDNEGL